MNAGAIGVKETIGERVRNTAQRLASKAIDLNQFADKLTPFMDCALQGIDKAAETKESVYPEYFQALRESLATIENCLDSVRDKINRVEI